VSGTGFRHAARALRADGGSRPFADLMVLASHGSPLQGKRPTTPPARNWCRRARPRSRSQTGRGAPSAEGVSLRRRARPSPSVHHCSPRALANHDDLGCRNYNSLTTPPTRTLSPRTPPSGPACTHTRDGRGRRDGRWRRHAQATCSTSTALGATDRVHKAGPGTRSHRTQATGRKCWHLVLVDSTEGFPAS